MWICSERNQISDFLDLAAEGESKESWGIFWRWWKWPPSWLWWWFLVSCMCVCELLSGIWLFSIPRTVACQAPLSMGFFRQEYWSGLPFSPPGNLPNPVIEPRSLALQADSLTSEPPGAHLNTSNIHFNVYTSLDVNYTSIKKRRIWASFQMNESKF